MSLASIFKNRKLLYARKSPILKNRMNLETVFQEILISENAENLHTQKETAI